MTPIEKNIIVVDEQGNEYEATYPKRAKGLVKNGRARFVDDNKICLACSPKEILEDKKMENTTTQTKYSIEYILEQVAKIQEQTDYLNQTIEKLSVMDDGDSGDGGSPGNILGQAKAQALGDVVRYREKTNQQMLKLYEKMYDDLSPYSNSKKIEVLGKLAEIADGKEDFNSDKLGMLEKIRQIFQENFKE